jgi:arylformamidase
VQAWQSAANTRYEEITGTNHFTVCDPLTDPQSAMVARIAELAVQVKA